MKSAAPMDVRQTPPPGRWSNCAATDGRLLWILFCFPRLAGDGVLTDHDGGPRFIPTHSFART